MQVSGRADVEIYLDTAAVMAALIEHDAVAECWEDPSVLKGMRVAGLSGHLARSVLLTEGFLDEGPAPGTPLSTAEYYLAGGDPTDHDSRASQRIRETGEETAERGVAHLRTAVQDAIGRLRDRLPDEDLETQRHWFGRVTTTRTVLQARTLEMVIHIDDLAASTRLPTPQLPPAALDLTIEILVDMARHRHDDLAVIRALARRERDTVQALRVL